MVLLFLRQGGKRQAGIVFFSVAAAAQMLKLRPKHFNSDLYTFS